MRCSCARGKSAAAVGMSVLCGEKIFFLFCATKKSIFLPLSKSFILLQNGGLLARKSFFVMRQIDFFCGGAGKSFGYKVYF